MKRTDGRYPDAMALDGVWDQLVGTQESGDRPVDGEDLATILQLHALDDTPGPGERQIQAIWSTILPELQVERPVPGQGETASGAVVELLPLLPVRLPFDSGESSTSASGVDTRVASAAGAIVASFFLGFFLIGGGARVAMRLSALLTPDRLQGATTNNMETVGAISLTGSFFLMLTGGFAGVGLGLVFLAIRRWLPSDGFRRSLVTAVVFVSTGGAAVLERGQNPDYERFGIAGVNVCLFMALPLIFGAAIGPVLEAVERQMGRWADDASGIRYLAGMVVLLVLAVPMALVGFALLVAARSPLALLLLVPLIAAGMTWLEGKEVRVVQTRMAGIVGNLAIAIPCLIGFVFTLQAVARIL